MNTTYASILALSYIGASSCALFAIQCITLSKRSGRVDEIEYLHLSGRRTFRLTLIVALSLPRLFLLIQT